MSSERYLQEGNASFRQGENTTDPNEKMQHYARALETYMDGILQFPQDVPLKYNYEFVKQKMEELTEDAEQEGGDQSEDEGEEGESESGDQNEGEEEEEGEGSQAEQEEEENTEGEQGEQEQAEESDEEQGDEQDGAEQQEQDQDQAEIARILEMLESQEEESLKNNQEVITGKDEANGW